MALNIWFATVSIFLPGFVVFWLQSCEHKYFDYVVLLFILTSCVVLALEEPNMHPKVEPGEMYLNLLSEVV